MSNLVSLLWLVLLGTLIGAWLLLSRARERAAAEAERQCRRYGMQLLDDSVGLRALRLGKLDGRRILERGYGFEVSIDGDDRERGMLWISGHRLTGLKLPTVSLELADRRKPDPAPAQARPAALDASPEAIAEAIRAAGDKVVPLRRPGHDRPTRH